MHITGRQRQILALLLQHKEEITAAGIAENIKVSVRTVHRELAELEPILAASGAALHKKSGKGVQLHASDDELEALCQLVADGDAADYSSEERKLLLIMMLLQAEEPLKLFALAHDLRVTAPTVSHDLDELEGWIAKNRLQLIRRRGYGIEISGSESRVRSTICMLARNHLDDSDLFGSAAAPRQSPATSRLLDFIGKPYLLTVEAVLWQAQEEWLNELPESDYTDLLIHIIVALNRMRQGKWIEPGEDGCAAESLDEHRRSWLNRLSDSLRIALPDVEACHLAGLLERYRASGHRQLLTDNELGCRELVQRLIAAVERRLDVPFGVDRSLREGLVSHMDNALARLREGATIRNPLLASIKRDYEQLYVGIRQAVNESMIGLNVPDEEVGFLVMHFGASAERFKRLGRTVRAIIVCTSGIGSSKMLAVRLQKEFPQIEIVSHASWFEASRIPEESYDLIVSTVDLPIEPQRYIKLSPLLTKDETEKLRSYIQDVTLKISPAGTDKLGGEDADAMQRLHRLQTYVNEIVRLVDQFEVHELDNSRLTLHATLRRACAAIAHRGGLQDVEAVVRLLLARQQAGSQVIPDTRIALFHTRSERIARPSFTLFRLSEPLPLDSAGDGADQVAHLLLMLGPQKLSRESLEVLSEISSLLLNAELVALLETGSQQAIRQYLSKQLALFVANINQTDMRRELR